MSFRGLIDKRKAAKAMKRSLRIDKHLEADFKHEKKSIQILTFDSQITQFLRAEDAQKNFCKEWAHHIFHNLKLEDEDHQLERVISNDSGQSDSSSISVRSLPTGTSMLSSSSIVNGIYYLPLYHNKVKLVSVNGDLVSSKQRNVIHFFDNVTALLFTVDLSTFDNQEKPLRKILQLVNNILEEDYFKHKSTIILFTGKAILRTKLETTIFAKTFPQYLGINDYSHIMHFLMDWVNIHFNSCHRELYVAFVEGIKQDWDFVIEHCSKAIEDVVVRTNLEEIGLLAKFDCCKMEKKAEMDVKSGKQKIQFRRRKTSH